MGLIISASSEHASCESNRCRRHVGRHPERREVPEAREGEEGGRGRGGGEAGREEGAISTPRNHLHSAPVAPGRSRLPRELTWSRPALSSPALCPSLGCQLLG